MSEETANSIVTNHAERSYPPVVELVLGVQFSRLTKLTSGHFGLLWKRFGEEWEVPEDDIPLGDQFESFDDRPRGTPPQVRLRVGPVALPGRFKLTTRSGDRLIQMQPTRFHLNWRKRENFYPSYTQLVGEFERMFATFSNSVEELGVGRVIPNQWELTYVDAFPKGVYWDQPRDWSLILPGLFGTLFNCDDLELSLESRSAEWSYRIIPQRGRVHFAAHLGKFANDPRESILLNSTARGPTEGESLESIRAGLEIGHKAVLEAFRRIVSSDVRQQWEGRS